MVHELKPVPEVGKVYHVFDDGKIRLSRHSLEKVVEVIPIGDFVSNHMYTRWLEEIRACDWLYADSSDFVVVTEPRDDPGNHRYYARTKAGGWFGFGHFFGDGELDVDRTLWEDFMERVREGDTFDYDDEEIAEIEELDKI